MADNNDHLYTRAFTVWTYISLRIHLCFVEQVVWLFYREAKISIFGILHTGRSTSTRRSHICMKWTSIFYYVHMWTG